MKKKAEQNYLLIGILLIIFYWLMNHFGTVIAGFHTITDLLSPFFLGGVIAFILNVPMKQIEKNLFQGPRTKKLGKFRRTVAYLITLFLVVLIINLAILVVVPEVVATGRTLMEQIPRGINNLMDWLEKNGAADPEIWQQLQDAVSLDKMNWNSIITKIGSFLSVGTAGLISGGIDAVTGILSWFTSFFIGFVFSIYLLFQKEALSKQVINLINAFIPEKFAERIIRIARLTNTTFASFLSGQFLEAVILGTMFWLAMMIFRLPYALLVGIVIAITALIPIVGAFIGCALGAFLIAMVNPMQAVFFLILFLILQQIEGNLIYPHVVGNAVGLPSIWVLMAVSVGGSLFGVLGMLTFIPITSVCYTLLREFVRKRLIEKRRKKGSGVKQRNGSGGSNEKV